MPGLTHRAGIETPEFLLPRSLEPERMAAPPRTRSRRYKLGVLLIMLIAGIFAASAGYYVWMGDWTRSSQLAPGTQLASVGPKTNAPPSYVSQQELLRDDARATSAENEISSLHPETSQLATPSSDGTVATLQPSATGSQARPSSTAIRVLDPDEINLLMKQGEQLIAAGDVVTARTVFQRAAEAGDANAAMALGATYDPNVLAKLGVVGVSAEVEQARSWYQRAETLGSPDARRRLDVLADR